MVDGPIETSVEIGKTFAQNVQFCSDCCEVFFSALDLSKLHLVLYPTLCAPSYFQSTRTKQEVLQAAQEGFVLERRVS